MSGTRVTCADIESGESESVVITDNYILVTDGRCYLSSQVEHGNGTATMTVKRTPPTEQAVEPEAGNA